MIQHLHQNQGILQRFRLYALIREGLQYPLLVLMAGPGYGKTWAMADYLKKSDLEYSWLRLSSLDNLPEHFWAHLAQALERKDNRFSEIFKGSVLPETLACFGRFADCLSEMIENQHQVVWIFDDFGEINEPQILTFVKMLADIHLDNFHLVLISNQLASIESTAYMSKERFLISKEDLRFTRSEIDSLYRMHGIILEREELSELEGYTEGWPFSLSLLVRQHCREPVKKQKEERLEEQAVIQLFEEQFFSRYSRKKQKLLVQLSVLDSFTPGIYMSLSKDEEPEELKDHMFVNREPLTGRVSFHHQYHIFLRKKIIFSPLRRSRQSGEAPQNAMSYPER